MPDILTPEGEKHVPREDHHLISLKDAIKKAKKFRDEGTIDEIKQKRGGTFNRKIFDDILKNDRVCGIRYYFAFDKADNKTHLAIVVVGVDKDGNDILTTNKEGIMTNGGDNSWPNPPHGKKSPLNEDIP